MLTGWGRRMSLALLAPRCLVCSEPGDDGLDLCGACRSELPWNTDACEHCAMPRDPGDVECRHCRFQTPAHTLAQSALRYAFPIDRLLPRFKFHGDLAAGALLATLMHWALDPAEHPQLLIPVPLHRSRLRSRGYDQALELAKALSRDCRVPLCRDRLWRQRATSAQTELGAAARRKNVQDAFALRSGPPLPAHVALVDDVLTTGATLDECTRVLLGAGVRRVDVWTIARAP